MSLTAFLAPTLLSGLSDVSVSPSAGINRYPLTWNNSLGKWVASLLPISSLTEGPLPLTLGGTNSATGSIAATGALTFAAGGANQGITLNPSGTARTSTTRLSVTSTESSTSATSGAIITSGGIGAAGNCFIAGSLRIGAGNSLAMSAPSNVTEYAVFGLGAPSGDSFLRLAFGLSQGEPFFGFGSGSAFRDVAFIRNGPNTVRIAGNISGTVSATVQIIGSLSATGTKINFSGLPTSDANLAPGDLWRDGSFLKVKV